MLSRLDTELEVIARQERYCRGCGNAKEHHCLVCWDCFKRCEVPFKYFDGTLDRWLENRAAYRL